jgi:hypothetical protein
MCFGFGGGTTLVTTSDARDGDRGQNAPLPVILMLHRAERGAAEDLPLRPVCLD